MFCLISVCHLKKTYYVINFPFVFFLQFRLPAPKGGKHGVNPVLFEDQPMAHNRVAKKARAKNDVFDPDYVIKPSPFIINDVTSRAAQLGITPQTKGAHYWDKRNPNEVRKRGTKKK